ncbi:MAG: thioredoxin domain-containing protein [Acidobacteriota bacterium]
MRRVLLVFFLAVLCIAQTGWQAATTLPGVDLTGLTKAQREVALQTMRAESCNCGCGMKIAECRMRDPECVSSRRLANFVLKVASAGKSKEALRAELLKFAAAPENLLDDPIKLAIDGDPVRGPSNAKVTIVEFSDFQCPYCAKATVEVKQILDKYPKDVRFIFKQFPLDNHSQAAVAAEASLAAQAQGKFWEMHDKLYANFRDINRVRILSWAREIGLDVKRFTADLDSHKYRNRVTTEEKQGEDAGVVGTPTFYIDGKKLNSSFEFATVDPVIQAELKTK